jgi:hypothetical protein
VNRRLLGLAAVTGVLVLCLSPLGGLPRLAADTSVPSVSVSQTTGITDGQAVTITIKTKQDVPVSTAEANLCRGGVDYQPKTVQGFDALPADDFRSDGPNCPGGHPVSTSADALVNDNNTSSNAATADGESFTYRIGSGVTQWVDTNTNKTITLACDQSNPCSLVVELELSPVNGQPAQWKPFVFPITYGTTDAVAACGGPAESALTTGGGDRMQEAWVAWTLAACKRPGVHGAPTLANFGGEGNALSQFTAGSLDLAYTAGGYDKDMATGSDAQAPGSGLTTPDVTPRPSVAVPLALNAAVIGVGGGHIVNGHKVPFKTIKLTADQAAAMYGGGGFIQAQQSPTNPNGMVATDITSANPEFAQLFDNSAGFIVGAYADAEAFSWYATRWFKQAAPGFFKVPPTSTFGTDANKPRGVDAGLGLADPTYNQAVSLFSGRPAIRKGLIGPGPLTTGGIFVLTDLQTANALDLTPVQLPDAHGNYVAPTAETVTAAVPTMKADDHGVLVSDPQSSAGYPLSFVEYALVPAQPLLNDDCTARTDSQKLLTDWLTYVTGGGQSQLPAGMAPLPDSLKAQAADAIKKVGASPVTGTCAAAEQPPTIAAPSVPDAAPLGATGSLPSAGAPPAAGSAPSVVDYSQPPTLATAPLASGAASSTDAGAVAGTTPNRFAAVPAFAGRTSSGWSPPLVALVGIVTLTTLALAATAKPKAVYDPGA